MAVKQAAVTNAQQAFDRAKELLNTAVRHAKTLDDAQAALRQANANLEWSKTRLARRRALSPAAGTIEKVYYRPGETVPPGRAVIALLPPGNLKIRFFAPEPSCCPRSNTARRSAVTCDGCAAGLTAKVTFIAKSAEYTPPVIYSREERAKLVFLIEAQPAASGEIPRRPADHRHAAARTPNERQLNPTSSSTCTA